MNNVKLSYLLSEKRKFSLFWLPMPVTRATNEPEMPFARHQRSSQRGTLVVVIIGDCELLTSTPCSVADEMSLVSTGFYTFPLFIKMKQNEHISHAKLFDNHKYYCISL